ncbi:MAG: site-specific integrase [Armatimonadota bacterium]
MRQVLRGIRRTIGTASKGKAPILSADIAAMVAMLPDTLLGLRDRTLLLVGFAGGFRRSELAGISVEHLEETDEGVKILLPRSKTDQEGRGRLVAILRGKNPATCPVRALRAWREAAEITSGPVFRRVDRHGRVLEPLRAQAVALVVKRAAVAAQLDPAQYAGHSLRSGLVTQAAKNKATVADIMRQTGHRSTETVNRYVRKANIFEDNISGIVGL